MNIWDDLETLTDWHNACDPHTELEAGQYVDFDGWQDPAPDGTIPGLRGEPFVRSAYTTIDFMRRGGQSCQLMTGFRGAGKSTELARLADKLSTEGFAVIQADARKFDNFTRAHTIEELTLVLAAAIGDADGSAEKIGGPTKRNIFQRIGDFLQTEAEATSAKVNFGLMEIGFELKNSDNFRNQVREVLQNKQPALRAWFHALIEELRKSYDGMPVAILIDGLEKYDSIDPRDVEKAYRSAAAIFENFSDWLSLPGVHVVYCVAPLLATMTQELEHRYDKVHPPLASVRIHRRPPSNERCEAGYEALAMAMSKRVDLGRLFGPNQSACTAELIRLSGGHVRELFLLLGKAIHHTRTHRRFVSVDDLRSIAAKSYGAFGVDRSEAALMLDVQRRGSFASTDIGTVARILDRYLVLAYANGEPWFDISPRGRYLLERSAPASGDV